MITWCQATTTPFMEILISVLAHAWLHIKAATLRHCGIPELQEVHQGQAPSPKKQMQHGFAYLFWLFAVGRICGYEDLINYDVFAGERSIQKAFSTDPRSFGIKDACMYVAVHNFHSRNLFGM